MNNKQLPTIVMKKSIKIVMAIGIIWFGVLAYGLNSKNQTKEVVSSNEGSVRLLVNPLFTHLGLLDKTE